LIVTTLPSAGSLPPHVFGSLQRAKFANAGGTIGGSAAVAPLAGFCAPAAGVDGPSPLCTRRVSTEAPATAAASPATAITFVFVGIRLKTSTMEIT
jgi:hypothetical protein